MGKQPKKEQLQQQIADLQQQLLGLEQAQLEWKREQQASAAFLKGDKKRGDADDGAFWEAVPTSRA